MCVVVPFCLERIKKKGAWENVEDLRDVGRKGYIQLRFSTSPLLYRTRRYDETGEVRCEPCGVNEVTATLKSHSLTRTEQ